MMARSTPGRTALMAALAAVAMGPTADAASLEVRPGAPARTPVVDLVSSETNTVPMQLGIGKSVVIDLPHDIKDVLVADPKIANAVIRSSRRAYLIGVAIGQTNVFFFDADGRQIAGFDIAVKRDLNGIRAALQHVVPQGSVQVEGLGDGVMLSGSVATPTEAQQALDLATRLVGDEKKVVNGITIRGRDQVMLKVTVAEVQRDVVKQLGVNLNGSFSHGTAVVSFNTDNPVSAGTALSAQGAIDSLTGLPRIGATIRAMERAGVIRTLAEPNLTAISGETANFLAGGEFPIVTGSTCSAPTTCVATIEFKKFGVSLNFTPVVLSEGRISLRVMTEVSELSTEGALVTQGVSIPSIKTRRADTTVEIPSGGSLVMAGMIQEQSKQQINGVPGLAQLPVLGTLFRSRDFINRQTELMVMVTPYVVRAVAQKDLSRPDDGFADASDPTSTLIGRLNRIYGVAGRRPELRGGYRGTFGFILD
jgi:pilus assembly protein CpaC